MHSTSHRQKTLPYVASNIWYNLYVVYKGVSIPHLKSSPITRIPPFLKIPHPPPYQQIHHFKFFLLTEMQLQNYVQWILFMSKNIMLDFSFLLGFSHAFSHSLQRVFIPPFSNNPPFFDSPPLKKSLIPPSQYYSSKPWM